MKPLICPKCSFRFEPKVSCKKSCGNHSSSCSTAHCPNCSTSFLKTESAFSVTLIKKLFKKNMEPVNE